MAFSSILGSEKGSTVDVGKNQNDGGNTEQNTDTGNSTIPDSDMLDKAKAGDGHKPQSTGKRGRKAKPKNLQNELPEHLFQGKAWQGVAALPFNVRRAMTGSDIFSLDKDQKEILGDGLGAVMKTLGMIDPRYLALTVFSVNLISIWSEKEIIYAMANRKKEPSS